MIPIESNIFAIYSLFLFYRFSDIGIAPAWRHLYVAMPNSEARASYNIVIYVDLFHTPGSHGSTASIPSHHLPTTIYTDSTRTPSLTGHIPLSPSHTLATRKRESAAHAPHIFRKHTTIELGVTGIRLPAYPYRISFLSTAQYRSEACFSLAPCLVWNPEPSRKARHFVCSHDSKAPLDKRDDSRGWKSGGVLSPCV